MLLEKKSVTFFFSVGNQIQFLFDLLSACQNNLSWNLYTRETHMKLKMKFVESEKKSLVDILMSVVVKIRARNMLSLGPRMHHYCKG